MQIYIPGNGREYKQISTDEKVILEATGRLHAQNHPMETFESLAKNGALLKPGDYESYWGSEEITREESGKNIPQVMANMFQDIEEKRIRRAADIALIQDPRISINRSSAGISLRLLLLNRKI